jgi:hypothetical protein
MPNTSSSVPFLLSSSMSSIRSRRPSACLSSSQGSGLLQQLGSGMVRQLTLGTSSQHPANGRAFPSSNVRKCPSCVTLNRTSCCCCCCFSFVLCNCFCCTYAFGLSPSFLAPYPSYNLLKCVPFFTIVDLLSRKIPQSGSNICCGWCRPCFLL